MPSRLPRLEAWGDESGNLDFDPRTGSKYFIVSTVTVADPGLSVGLLDLRREMDRQGFELPEGFHATEDKQAVRDEVFRLLTTASIRADFTYYTKARVYTRIQGDPDYFYKWAWFYHLRHVLPKIVPKDGELFIGIATLGVRKKRQLHAKALRDVVGQCLRRVRPHCAHWTAASHPCLQAADYYTWAAARWLEQGDDRSWRLIEPQVGTLYRFI
jgi:hypothetical protein